MKRLKKKTSKQSKRRAAEPPDCNLNGSSVPLDLDAELNSLLAKNKLLPSDEVAQDEDVVQDEMVLDEEGNVVGAEM